jgi:hypothetical protein
MNDLQRNIGHTYFDNNLICSCSFPRDRPGGADALASEKGGVHRAGLRETMVSNQR